MRVLFDGVHLTGWPLDNLHEFARQCGLKREWFQDARIPHYDVTGPTVRRRVCAALERKGLGLLTTRELVMHARQISEDTT